MFTTVVYNLGQSLSSLRTLHNITRIILIADLEGRYFCNRSPSTDQAILFYKHVFDFCIGCMFGMACLIFGFSVWFTCLSRYQCVSVLINIPFACIGPLLGVAPLDIICLSVGLTWRTGLCLLSDLQVSWQISCLSRVLQFFPVVGAGAPSSV